MKIKNPLVFKQIVLSVLILFVNEFFCQKQNIPKRIDSLIAAKTEKPFNGIILISEDRKVLYTNAYGYSDLKKKTSLKWSDQFVIGSVSKQFTAVLVLLEYEKGHLDLDSPIKNYLQELTQSWADSVTVYHLLTHTHGITALNRPLSFKPGTQFSYSQIGYHLLASILEQVGRKSFAGLSNELFKKINMINTFHPDLLINNLVKAYTETKTGGLKPDSAAFENYPAAGSFVSTANDLLIWNENLHSGKILKESTYKMMITKQKNAIRYHPIFGETSYGLGITVDTKDDILQLGQTGFTPGFVSMNFYFPKNKTSLIVLENVSYYPDDLKKKFFYQVQILNMLRQSYK